MKEPTQEVIKEFWEWYGFEHIGGYTIEWIAPDGQTCLDVLPPIDLNNLFKWAVPKVQTRYEIAIILPPGNTGRAIVRIGHNEPVDMLTLKDALFWAIYQVIKEEKMK
jgi:hypothetical protein